MSRTTIGINLTWLVPGVVGGSEEYSVGLLRAAGNELTDYDLRLYARSDLFSKYRWLGDVGDCIEMPEFADSRWKRIVLEHSWLAQRAADDAIVHHFGGVVPRIRSTPALVTIYDLQPLEMPENFSRLKRTWLGAMIPYSVRAARGVICLTHHTKAKLESVLDVPPAKIRVVPGGFDRPGLHPSDLDPSNRHPANRYKADSFKGRDRGSDEGTDPEWADSIGPDYVEQLGRYLLYPAIAYKHKRHCDLLDALPKLSDEGVSVVFTGREGPETDRLRAMVERLGVKDRVHFLGRVPKASLDALYAGAQAMVFPSEYEGFGNPVIEAMARGCPVVISSAPTLVEVAGDACLVADTASPASLAVQIERLLRSDALVDTLRRKGLLRAATFSSKAAAEALRETYQEFVY